MSSCNQVPAPDSGDAASDHAPDARIIASTIAPEEAGQRLDLWLSRRFTYHSRRRWQEAIRSGRILLNNTRSRCARILQAGETVIFRPERAEPPVTLSYEIIYEDEYLYAVAKSGNLPCHPAGPFFRHTLWYDMTRRYGKVYLINRLDRETSGLLLLGKSAAFAARMSALFQTDAISKKYYALV
ncbi:MAG: RluA family pseudouridine synthase, partial [Victivallales bacterium]|nr:RluA family pseudouridine synthase [Victivallales bacterium]